MFNSPKFHLYRNNEHIQFNSDTLSITKEADPTELKVKAEFDALKECNLKLENAYLVTQGSELTKEIADEDDNRDACVSAIKKIVEGYAGHYDKEYSDAGILLLNQFNKYGENIANMNYQAETTAIKDLTEEVKTGEKLPSAVNKLHLTEMFDYLEKRNTGFNNLYLQRFKEEGGKSKENLRELRNESITLYRKLTKRIEAYAYIEPSPLYDEVIKTVNTMIDKYNQLRRKTKVKDDITDIE